MKKYLLTLSAVVLTSAATMAQNDLPPNAVPGKCYAKCLKPAQFTTRTEQYVSKEGGKQLSVTGAEIGTTTDQLVIKEGSKRYEASAATYKTVTEQMLVKEAGKRTELVPGSGSYKAVTEQMETRPAYKRYEIVGCKQEVAGASKTGVKPDPTLHA